MNELKKNTIIFGHFADNLTIAFIVLKLAKQIDWSWWWVFSPIWIPLALFFIFTIIWASVQAADN